jgi:hypothetical protein
MCGVKGLGWHPNISTGRSFKSLSRRLPVLIITSFSTWTTSFQIYDVPHSVNFLNQVVIGAHLPEYGLNRYYPFACPQMAIDQLHPESATSSRNISGKLAGLCRVLNTDSELTLYIRKVERSIVRHRDRRVGFLL